MLLAALSVNLFYAHQAATNDHVISGWFHDSDANRGTGADFRALYAVGNALAHGGDIYTDNLTRWVGAVCYQPYRYLPIGALVGLPLTAMSWQSAQLLWLVFTELLTVLCALAAYRLVRGFAGAIIAAAWLAGTPLYPELHMGQFNMLQSAFLFAALAAAAREKFLVSDAGVCGAMVWKMTGWIAAPALVLHRRWWALLSGAVLTGGSLAVYFLFTGGQSRPFWQNFNPTALSAGIPFLYRGDLGFIMFLRVLTNGNLPPVLLRVIPLAAAAFSLAVMIVGRRASLADHLALWFSAYFFIYLSVWEHHYLMLLPPLTYLAARTRSWVLWPALLLYALPTPYVMVGPVGVANAGPWALVYHAVKPLAAALVFAVAVWCVWRNGRPPAVAPKPAEVSFAG